MLANQWKCCTQKHTTCLKGNDLKENCASCWRENFLFLTCFPPPLSHSNHQLERLFIDPLLPSASSYPPSTPVSFFSCSLPPFVSRAVGQRERDVTGIKNVRKARMRERCALGAEVSRRDQRANMKGNWRDRRRYMESESVCVCVCAEGVCNIK